MDQQVLLPGEEQDYYEEYFLKIEALFAALRGRGVLLSPADYNLARTWYEKGIPLSCVLRGIHAAFYRQMMEREDEEEEILSLKWCKWAVTQEWKDYRSLGVAELEDTAESRDLELDQSESVLSGLVFDLQQVQRSLGQQQMSVSAEKIAAILLDLEQAGDQVKDDHLQQLDAELLQSVQQEMPPAELKKLEKSVARKLKDYKSRMSAEAYQQSLASALADKVRQHYSLPKLTLNALQF